MTDMSFNNNVLLTVSDLVVEFPLGRRSKIHAVSGVSFHIDRGETLGLVGESGCGKSTLARAIVRLEKPTRGEIQFDNESLVHCTSKRLRKIRPELQMIFQDAVASLNPGRSIGETIVEPLRVIGKIGKKTRFGRARELMQQVGLDPDRDYVKRPHEFSGGQCQRISIARALITQPKLLICDEPVSSLDVSVQAQVLNLLESMKAHYNLTLLFISHDLAVVKNISDRVAVMYLGNLCEVADSESLYRSPRHPYTAALLASIPTTRSSRVDKNTILSGIEIPSPADPPAGCAFHTRCPRVQNRCRQTRPDLKEISTGRQVACHYPL